MKDSFLRMPVRWPTIIQADRHYGKSSPYVMLHPNSYYDNKKHTADLCKFASVDRKLCSTIGMQVMCTRTLPREARGTEKYVRIRAATERTREIPDHWTDPRACIL